MYKEYTAAQDIPHLCVKAGQVIKLTDQQAQELSEYLEQPKKKKSAEADKE